MPSQAQAEFWKETLDNERHPGHDTAEPWMMLGRRQASESFKRPVFSENPIRFFMDKISRVDEQF
ncbi:MAG: hypothetical protein VXX31_00480, partial [Planctomycetota bacterium]|nr:hypothetical protein [Planctomycetota bacterium]